MRDLNNNKKKEKNRITEDTAEVMTNNKKNNNSLTSSNEDDVPAVVCVCVFSLSHSWLSLELMRFCRLVRLISPSAVTGHWIWIIFLFLFFFNPAVK